VGGATVSYGEDDGSMIKKYFDLLNRLVVSIENKNMLMEQTLKLQEQQLQIAREHKNIVACATYYKGT